jgi:hypothetical protein
MLVIVGRLTVGSSTEISFGVFALVGKSRTTDNCTITTTVNNSIAYQFGLSIVKGARIEVPDNDSAE